MADFDSFPLESRIRKTLGLAGLTLHAMTLVSPGAFVWLVFPFLVILSGDSSGAGIFAGVLAAWIISLITISGMGQLAGRYPMAGSRSGFHFLQAVFEEYAPIQTRGGLRVLKWTAAWLSHIYYWTYPGILLSLCIQIVGYVMGDYGIHPTPIGQALMVVCLSGLIGFLALRGISGSNSSSILLNIIQTGILGVFCLILVTYRVIGSSKLEWFYPDLSTIFKVGSWQNLVIQASLAYFLVSGFQALAATGIWGAGGRENFSRRGLIGLLLQNGFSYIFQLLAIMLALQISDVKGLSPSGAEISIAPISAMVIRIGDQLLWKNGYAFFLMLVGAVLISLLASLLTAFNTAVRVNFAISVDPEMPGVLRLLPTQIATPNVSVYLISGITAIIGIGSTIGGFSVLPGAMLAANLGALGLNGLICAATLLPTPYHQTSLVSEWPALLVAILNTGVAALILFIGATAGGLIGMVIWWGGCLILAITLITLLSTFAHVV